MNIRELKEIINDLPDDLPIYLEADHGQAAIRSSWAGTIKYESDEEEPWSLDEAVFSGDEDEYTGLLPTCLLIQAYP